MIENSEEAENRVFNISVQALAGEIVEAVRKDEKNVGCDISAGLFGPEFSNLIRRIVADYLTKPQHHRKLREFIVFVESAPVSSGVCCCGEDMATHSSESACGHTPKDQWDHSLDLWLKELGYRQEAT